MAHNKKIRSALVIGALGVVFGDIGTSPLYALQAVFGPIGQHLAINQTNVHGIISLIVWSVTIVVSLKYLIFVMRADNEGEGGIIALIALIKSSKMSTRYASFFVLLGLIGLALFYGDSAITPAISVLSAVEGLHVVAPSLSSFVLPITFMILTLLFWIQKYGTSVIGKLFGPVMLLWFMTIGAGGAWQISRHPTILNALSPVAAFNFVTAQPLVAFIALGAVVLTITGAEALYADMGHFGRQPIARAWFLVVFPALTLCYMGQGALILDNHNAATNPLVLLFPDFMRFTIVILATVATLIASQSVISGAFSLTRQAAHLNFLPKMIVRHTSIRESGQVYLPFVNVVLFVVVVLLVFIFRSSQNLAGAYGMAVSATLAVDTILFVVVVRVLWQKSIAKIGLLLACFLTVDLLFTASNLSKLLKGGWFPLTIAAIVFAGVTTWIKGQQIVTKERRNQEGSLESFIDKIRTQTPPIPRIAGQAVYIAHHADLAPLALHATVEKLHELHEKVVIVLVHVTNASHVPEKERAQFDNLVYNDDGISELTLSYGYHDSINVPKTLKSLRSMNPELDLDPDKASYFVSLAKVVTTRRQNMSSWRKTLYGMMERNATSASDYYHLPTDRTVEMRSLLEL